jgi:hypothetical protein
MPTYRYQCKRCAGEFETWQSIHADALTVHEEPVPSEGVFGSEMRCGGGLVRVQTPPALFGIGARGDTTRDATAREAQWNRDMPAYKRLVKQGYQPQRIDGCGDLEQTAKGDFHIRSGIPYSDELVESRAEHVNQIMSGNA